MQSLLILGRQPALGLAELESLYGANKLKPVGQKAVIVDVDPCLLAFDRLGGAVKFAKVLSEISSTDWSDISAFLTKSAPEHSKSMPPGKMHLGISSYGFKEDAKDVLALAIKLKSAIRSSGRSVHVVPNNTNELSSAQVIHNRLTSPNGWELLLIKDRARTVIAQTIMVQNITAYARRDQARPARDTKVGMLPPKLAQIIINLSVGRLPAEATRSVCETPTDQIIPKSHFENSLLLDPFCGSGVIIQEAAIMGYDSIGTDIDQRMVDYTHRNLNWLAGLKNSPLHPKIKLVFTQADATSYQWQPTPTFIASELFLGQPYTSRPIAKQLQSTISNCDLLLRGFLTNIRPQLQKDGRLCLAIPAWQTRGHEFTHLPLLDSLEVIGYNRVSFQLANNEQLIYYRPSQIVCRELVVLSKS